MAKVDRAAVLKKCSSLESSEKSYCEDYEKQCLVHRVARKSKFELVTASNKTIKLDSFEHCTMAASKLTTVIGAPKTSGSQRWSSVMQDVGPTPTTRLNGTYCTITKSLKESTGSSAAGSVAWEGDSVDICRKYLSSYLSPKELSVVTSPKGEVALPDQYVTGKNLETAKCMEVSLTLLELFNPDGNMIYAMLRNKNTYSFFIRDCVGNGFIEATDSAIHESLHSLDGEKSTEKDSAYYLINGKSVYLPKINTPPRNIVVNEMKPDELDDSYTATYLTDSSVSQSLDSLLEELNGYTHGGYSSLLLAERLQQKTEINPGLTRMMLYLELYMRSVRVKSPSTWSHIKEDPLFQNAISELWKQAEVLLKKIENSKYATIEDKFLKKVYEKQNLVELYLAFEIKASNEKWIR